MTEIRTHETNLNVLTPGKKVSGEVFLVKKIEVAISARNTKYYTATLSNKHGEADIKIWTPHEVLDTDDFVQVWMEVKEKPKWGPQWDISHYIKSSYAGDELFSLQVGIDPLEEIAPLLGYPYQNETIKSLIKAFRIKFLKDSLEEDSNFYFVPAYKEYYYGKSGLVRYLRTMYDISSGYTKVSREILNSLILFHHLGSVSSFEAMVPTETYYLSNMKMESNRVLEDLKHFCMKEGLSLDMYTFKEITHTCFNPKLLTPEALIFRNARDTAIALYKLEKNKDSNTMFKETPDGVIFNRDHWKANDPEDKNKSR